MKMLNIILRSSRKINEHLISKKESKKLTKDFNEVSRLKKDNEILKHELEITNIKLILKDDDKKIESYLIYDNIYLRPKLEMIYELQSSKLQYAELEKYNAIVKEELTQSKQHLKKLYSIIEKLGKKIYI